MSERVNLLPEIPILAGKGLPEFQKITPSQINKNIPILIKTLIKDFRDLEKDLNQKLTVPNASLSWDEIMTPLSEIGESLRWSWGLVSHLNSVCNSKELREAHSAQQSSIIEFTNILGQSKSVYKALCSLRDNPSKDLLNTTQKRILEAEILSMDQRGVGLQGQEKEAFNTNSQRIAKLSTNFSNNVLDATQAWSLLLEDPLDINGIPHRALEAYASSAKAAGDLNQTSGGEPTPEKGPWRIGLDMPSYIAFMTYATNRSLRERIYKAHISRASTGELNNQSLIEEILVLRKKQAHLLGYNSWAEVSLSTKMAKDIKAVEELLDELRRASMPAAEKEFNDLKAFAKKHGFSQDLELAPWDLSFWAEQLRQERYNLDQEALRPWFPLPQVLDGLFNLCEKLFDIKINAADGEAPIWHEDVLFFKVSDHSGSHIASFYLDPYTRPSNKRSGAWMDECLIRRKTSIGDIELPVAYLICNQTPPTKDKPSLMSFEEVQTLFHEFGHGLQHMLTDVDYPQAAGINNIEWDAVELPSQFMENWCLEESTISEIASHWENKSPLPVKEFQKLRDSRNFNSGIAMLRQIHFALTDLRLHNEWDPSLGKTPDEMRREIATSTSVIPPIPEDQFLCCFNHIFAGGYSAGYYSYKWAEVLSADAFAAFEEEGLENKKQIRAKGRHFRETILSQGGSRHPSEIFKDFRGRQPSTEALIRHSGLATTTH